MQGLLRFAALIDAMIAANGRLLRWIVTIMILIGFLNVVLRYIGRYCRPAAHIKCEVIRIISNRGLFDNV